MATLKSPRNTRNKRQWAQQSAFVISQSPSSLRRAPILRSQHRMHRFILRSMQSVVNNPDQPAKLSEKLVKHTDEATSHLLTTYGKRTLNNVSVHPTLLSYEMRLAPARFRFVAWSNSSVRPSMPYRTLK